MDSATQTYNMQLTRVFDAPVARVWQAWSDADDVMRWWGPKGFTSPLCKMNFREGGVTLVCMRAPAEYGGMDMYNTWTYTKIIPMQRIEFIQNFTDQDANKFDPAAAGFPPGIPFDVPHVLLSKPIGDNQTEFTVTEFGYASPEAVEISKSGMVECLDKMEALVSAV